MPNSRHDQGSGERCSPALSHDNGIPLVKLESWRNVSSDVLVALLVPIVLPDVVKVITTDDDGPVGDVR